MLAADDLTNPHLSAVADAAKEIAELKAKVAQLEKLIDSIMARHLAGIEPLPVAMDSYEDSADEQPQTVAELTGDSFSAPIPDDIMPISQLAPEPCSSPTDDLEIGDTESDPGAPEAATPHYEALPSSVLSLICRPTKTALNSTDDLTLITTIDAFTALELAAHGTNRFEDIANLDAPAVAEIMQKIPGTEHLLKDGWIEQAAILATGELTAYAHEVISYRAAQEGSAESNETSDANNNGVSPLALLDRRPKPAPTPASNISFEVAAEAALKNLTERELPRTMVISCPIATEIESPNATTSFLPMAASDAGFAVKKIPHRVETPPKDHGNARALAVSVSTAAVVFVSAFFVDSASFGLDASQIVRADLCQMTGLTTLTETCKQILASVL